MKSHPSSISSDISSDSGQPLSAQKSLERERHELLARLEDWLETPMLALAFLWLALLVVELLWGTSPLFEIIGTVIWIIFIADFILELILAPRKLAYIKRNWLTMISLLLPALRIFRIVRLFRLARVARAGRSLRLARVVSSLNRAMNALRASLRRRGFGYVVLLSVIVTFVGAAGMYTFEHDEGGHAFVSYGESLWWTAMIMTTMGSQDWPKSAEGRMLCFALALYAFTIFGYVTAILATYFIGRDAESDETEIAGAQSIIDLRAEITALRAELRDLKRA